MPTEPTTTVEVKVTQSHIDAGMRGKCEGCAVDLAIKDAGIIGMTVLVECVAYDSLGGKTETIELSSNVANFIRAFDANCPVYPISFPFTVPTRFLRAAKGGA